MKVQQGMPADGIIVPRRACICGAGFANAPIDGPAQVHFVSSQYIESVTTPR